MDEIKLTWYIFVDRTKAQKFYVYFSIYLMLYEIENECLSALCQMRNKLPELFNPTVSKMDLFLRQKVDLGHQSIA